jgi:hypothetical protein
MIRRPTTKLDVTSLAGNAAYIRFSFGSGDRRFNTGKGIASENVMTRADK